MEFSKKERKILRIIIEKGLQREFATGLEKAEAVIKDWRQKAPDENREHYHRLFQTVHDFDKHISRLYDRMSGSNYGLIVLAQLQGGVIGMNDLSELSDDVRARYEWLLRND